MAACNLIGMQGLRQHNESEPASRHLTRLIRTEWENKQPGSQQSVRERKRLERQMLTEQPNQEKYADHHQPAYPNDTGALPATEAACASVLSLPCYQGIPDDHVERVIGAVQAYFVQVGVASC